MSINRGEGWIIVVQFNFSHEEDKVMSLQENVYNLGQSIILGEFSQSHKTHVFSIMVSRF